MDFDFGDRRVLVVGGSSGIGNGIARAFLDRGASVDIWGTRAQADDYGPEEGDLTGLNYWRVDASDKAAVAAAAEAFDRLDILVLSQGTVLYRREEFTAEGFDHVSLVNLNSIAYCALALRPALARSDSAALVIVSSSAAYRTTFGNPAYNASKAGLLGLIRSLAAAWIGDGIRVNGIAPGLVETKLTHVTTRHPERLENALGTIPSRRLGTARDMAGAALYLASPLSDYVVGQTIVVDGGASL